MNSETISWNKKAYHKEAKKVNKLIGFLEEKRDANMEKKPKIYLYCIHIGTGSGCVGGSTPGGDVIGFALAEDGTCLTSHYSSNESFSKHDIGLTSNWKHEIYEEHYPDGFELEWIEESKYSEHTGFLKAFENNKVRTKPKEELK